MFEDDHTVNESLDDRSLRQRRSSRIIWVVRLAIALAMLAGLFYLVPAAQVFAEFGRSAPEWLIAAFLLALCTQFAVSVRLKMLANVHGLGLSTVDALQVNLATHFYAMVVPGGMVTTMAIRSFRLGCHAQKGYAGAITAVALDRTLATLTLSAAGIMFWLLDWPQSAQVWLGVMVITFLALAVTVCLLGVTVFSPTACAAPRLPMSFLNSRLERMREAVAQALSMRRLDLYGSIALSFLAHLFGMAGHVCVAAALDLDVGILALGWIRATLILAAMIPISLSGLGLREGASLLTLTAYGVGSDASIAFSLLIAAVTVFGTGLLGGIVEGLRFVLGRRTPLGQVKHPATSPMRRGYDGL